MDIEIKYCVMCGGYEAIACGLARAILVRFKTAATVRLVPVRLGGHFEVSLGGALVHSKLATYRFPAELSLLDELASRAVSAKAVP